jgi:tRNA dimethylallyltransferase
MGLPALHAKLKTIDPIAANKIHANDPQRTLRALEVFYLTGKKLSELQGQRASRATDIQFFCIALAPASREALHQRIEQRFEQMLQAGFLHEVEKLYQRSDLHANLPAIRAVGYRQAWHYLQGDITYDEMVAKAIVATRQLAKRQLTWLRHWPNLHWLDSDDTDLVTKALELIHEQQITD